jgi:hypothetical protein
MDAILDTVNCAAETLTATSRPRCVSRASYTSQLSLSDHELVGNGKRRMFCETLAANALAHVPWTQLDANDGRR